MYEKIGVKYAVISNIYTELNVQDIKIKSLIGKINIFGDKESSV